MDDLRFHLSLHAALAIASLAVLKMDGPWYADGLVAGLFVCGSVAAIGGVRMLSNRAARLAMSAFALFYAASAVAIVWFTFISPKEEPATEQEDAFAWSILPTAQAAGQKTDVLDMEEADAVRLEKQLAGKPDDMATRLALMQYYRRADHFTKPENVAKRVAHVLWIIEHQPDAAVPAWVWHLSPRRVAKPDYERALGLWKAAADAQPRNAAIQWNAATFFERFDPALHLEYLERTAAADPNHPHALRPLANLYANSILDGGPLAAKAQAGLDASKNVWVLGNAAYMLQSQYNAAQPGSERAKHAKELAEKYFLRARAIDRNLDRNKILPQLPATTTTAPAQPSPVDLSKVRRLALDAFPQLPPAVSRTLQARKCRVPQPGRTGTPRNVIRGEFFAKGEQGWAVLCSVSNATTLLAFRSDQDTRPAEVDRSDDSTYAQHDGTYPHEIRAVDRTFIMRHYRAYGGPQPPPVDHHGIDDAFLEKASVIWYFHNGKWLQLQGSD